MQNGVLYILWTDELYKKKSIKRNDYKKKQLQEKRNGKVFLLLFISMNMLGANVK